MSKDLSDALESLTATSRFGGVLPDPPARGAKPAQASAAKNAGKPGGSSAGIASPLTETSFAAREFHATAWKTSDGLFTLPAIKKLTFTDADGNAVVINLAAPPA